MQDTSLHLDAFCQFWEMNFSSPVPPLPKRPEDLTVTQAEQLRIFDGGKLYQNLFKVTDPKKLPANLARDISKGLIDYQNKNLYRQFGWEHEAQRIEQAEIEYEQSKINKEIAEMEKRNAEQARVNEARKNMSFNEKLALEAQGQTMDQVIRNRMKYHGRVD
tara:strand:- start:1071 stop:1556 length:486 start_codon:yes stop_codon:yes gene_type:complete